MKFIPVARFPRHLTGRGSKTCHAQITAFYKAEGRSAPNWSSLESMTPTIFDVRVCVYIYVRVCVYARTFGALYNNMLTKASRSPN